MMKMQTTWKAMTMNDGLVWMAEPGFLERTLRAIADSTQGATPLIQRSKSSATAEISIVGLLLPTVPEYYREMGISATGYDEITDQARAAINSREDTVYMSVSSGGGSINGIDGAIDALRELASVKRVVAYVDGMAASAAYWLSIIAHEIHATRMSEVGGIGAFYVLPKGSNNVVVVRSAPHKGAGIDGWTEEQLAAMQSTVDTLGKWFWTDVTNNRGITDATTGSGRVWLAEDALQRKLIDGVTEPGALAAENKRRLAMSEQMASELAQAQAALKDLQAKEAARAEMMAAFPDDPGYALAQIQAGATVADAMKTKMAELKAQADAAKAEAEKAKSEAATAAAGAVANGSKPEPEVAAPEAANWNDAVAAYAHKHNCDAMTAARAVDRANPELRRAHLMGVIQKGGK